MLIIDGHNLIGQTPGLSLELEEEAREAVLQRIGAAKGAGGEPVVVVFDGNRPGAPKETRFGGLRVVYSPAGTSADDEILRRIRRTNPRAVTVVTSDQKLAKCVRSEGARVLSSRSFLVKMKKLKTRRNSDSGKPTPNSNDVETWLRVFGPDEEGSGHKM